MKLKEVMCGTITTFSPLRRALIGQGLYNPTCLLPLLGFFGVFFFFFWFVWVFFFFCFLFLWCVVIFRLMVVVKVVEEVGE